MTDSKWIVVFATQDMPEATKAEMIMLDEGVEVLFWNMNPKVEVEDPYGPEFEGAKLAVKEEQFDQAREILEREGFYDE